MSTELKNIIRNCEICNLNENYALRKPTKTHRIPTLPRERISADMFEIKQRNYLIIVDHYSDYFEIDELSKTTSSDIIDKCKQQFSRHGIPRVMVTDNAKQFTGTEFAKFVKEWQFMHVTSSPYHSQANGKAESAVKIAKQLIKSGSYDDTWMNILNWRNTPTVNMESSPTQRLMSRRTRSLIPMNNKLLKPEIQEHIPEKISIKRREAKKYYDRKARKLPELEIGEEVYVKTPPQLLKDSSRWNKGSIMSRQNQSSYEVETEGRILRRNRNWLRPVSKETSVNSNVEKEQAKESIDQNNQEQEKEVVEETTIQDDSQNHTRMTRSGRVVKTPKRYKDL